jgi:hypothetical protein
MRGGVLCVGRISRIFCVFFFPLGEQRGQGMCVFFSLLRSRTWTLVWDSIYI